MSTIFFTNLFSVEKYAFYVDYCHFGAIYSVFVYSEGMKPNILADAMTIWEYMRMHQQPARADCLLVLGSRDDRVAAYAARVSHEYAFEHVAITGGVSHTQDLLATQWGSQTEAEHFAEVFRYHNGKGTPILEQEATNTG